MSSKFGASTSKVSDEVEIVQSKITAIQNSIIKNSPLILLMDSTIAHEFDTELKLDFPAYNLYTDIKIDSNRRISFVSFQFEAKIKVSIRVMYNWVNAEYAPRFRYNLYVNGLLIISDGSDVNDSSDSAIKNISNVIFIHNFLKNDIVEIILTKPSGDDSFIIFRNSIIEFSYV
jgi:hypothetical protein